jgi:plastocyanin
MYLRASLAMAAATVVLGGCGSDSSSSTAPAADRAVSVDIAGFAFRPAKVEVDAGTRITWTNRDSAPHTATATMAPARFDTGTLKRGARSTRTLARPGTYAYVCELHPFMKATVVVREG